MGKKRKTRWRTLSIGAPPSEEDEVKRLQNGYVKNRETDNRSVHSFGQNDQSPGSYESCRDGLVGNSTVGSTAGGDNEASRSRRVDTPGSPSQPAIIFNEDEYTKIITPRQDVLLKKSYLLRKKVWASNASTSATPSTIESQSASHSTADGSETTEDQQLLDRDCSAGECTAPIMEPGAQISYGTFYDHDSGYYYEYPVMLVGPPAVPAPIEPSVLAAVPCNPVPLRPIEWINPAFVPKLSREQYCLMDYQFGQSTQGVLADDICVFPQPSADISNDAYEYETGSACNNVSAAGEKTEEQQQDKAVKSASQDEEQEQEEEQKQDTEQDVQPTEEQRMEENDVNWCGTYLEPVLVQQPVHMSHVSHVPHVVPAIPQPYLYPGHYMFGPPLVNVNGITIQEGPMIRTTDMSGMAPLYVTYAKRRKKKKKKKLRRLALGNTDGDEEGEYSSEYDNGVLSSRLPWSACPTPTPDESGAVSISAKRTQNRPLNPECEEFQLQPSLTVRKEKCALPDALTASDADASNSDETCVTSNPTDTPSSTIPDSVGQEGQSESNGSPSSNFEFKDAHVGTNGTLSVNSDQVNETTPEDNRSLTKTEHHRRRRNISVEAGRTNGTNDSVPTMEKSSETVVSNGNKEEVKIDAVNDVERCSEERCVLTNGESNLFEVLEDANKEDVPSVTNQRHDSSLPIVDREKAQLRKGSESRRKSESKQNSDQGRRSESKERLESKQSSENSVSKSRRKYSSKGAKFVREPTPGPDLSDEGKEAEEHTNENVTDAKGKNEATKEREKRELTPSMKVEKSAIETKNVNSENVNGISVDAITVEDPVNQMTILNDFVTKDVQRAGIDSISSETTNDVEMKAVIDGIAKCSTENSNFESQTQISGCSITKAVTKWLTRVNSSQELFITSAVNSASDSEDMEEDDDEDVDMDNIDKTPSKNLQGNPMPALSANGEVHSSRASCGEFARVNSDSINGKNNNPVIQEVESREQEKNERNRADGTAKKLRRGAMCSTRRRFDVAKTEMLLDSSRPFDNAPANVMLIDNSGERAPRADVDGNTCEFTQRDSMADMRVAPSSRIDLSKVESSRKRGRRSGKYRRDPTDVVSVKIRRSAEDNSGNDDGMVEDTIRVRTFEKKQIVVSVEGKFLPITVCEPFLQSADDLTPLSEISPEKSFGGSVSEAALQESSAKIGRNEKGLEEGEYEKDEIDNVTNNVMTGSLHIEEPDVLECWEAETIEPVITSKKMLQSRGICHDGEAAEEVNFEPEAENVKRVQRYYRLAEESAVNVDKETDVNENSVSSSYNMSTRVSGTVPNSPNQPTIEGPVCYEETPTSSERHSETSDDEKIPVDEAFEAYESCYTGKPWLFAFDLNVSNLRTFRKQIGEEPIPCRAICCNIQ